MKKAILNENIIDNDLTIFNNQYQRQNSGNFFNLNVADTYLN